MSPAAHLEGIVCRMEKMKINAIVTILVVLLFTAFSCTRSRSSGTLEPANEQPSPTVSRIPSDVDGIDYVITYDQEFANQDYAAEVFSGVPLTDTYAVDRGVNEGLVFLVFEHMRQVEEYVIPNEDISAVVRIRYDMDVYDRTDVIFTKDNVVMVHTTTSNAGIFTSSDVYILPYPETGFEYMSLMSAAGEGHERQLDILYAALLFYYRTVAPLNW